MSQFDVPVELRIIYLQRRVDEAPALDAELASGVFDMAKRVGHQIKGNAATFNFPDLTAYGISLEEAAKAGNKEEAQKISQEIKSVAEKLLREMSS